MRIFIVRNVVPVVHALSSYQLLVLSMYQCIIRCPFSQNDDYSFGPERSKLLGDSDAGVGSGQMAEIRFHRRYIVYGLEIHTGRRSS